MIDRLTSEQEIAVLERHLARAEFQAVQDDTAEAEADRAVAAAERLGPIINPEILIRFAAATREMLRNEDGTPRRDLLRAVAQRVEITSPTSADMMASRIELLRTLAANGGVESAALDVRSFVPEWRALLDSNQRPLA
jgi:site-specific DNA recombinase